MERRDVLAGLGCVAALGTAEVLRPRRKIVLMPAGAKLKDLVPRALPGWTIGGGGDIVIPRTEGSLAAQLYSDQVGMVYHHEANDRPDVMVLVAYGPAQNDALQLHRPEVCYPAIGFEIVERHFTEIPAGGGKNIPAVALTARAGDRIEDIVYWSRLGNTLPRTMGEQRNDRLKAALEGTIGDGVLFRASSTRIGETPEFDHLVAFLGEMVSALRPAARLALLGRNYTA